MSDHFRRELECELAAIEETSRIVNVAAELDREQREEDDAP